MPLQLSPLNPDEIGDFVRIQCAAFQSGMAHKMSLPLTPEKRQSMRDRNLKSLREDSDCHYLKVVDTDTNEIIACAKWRINLSERSEEVVEKTLPVVDESEGANRAERDFMRWLRENRWEWMGGRPFYLLHILVTDPKHHRRGAGGMLLRWGIEQADRDGLPSYLEASEDGRPLYERNGFKAIKEGWFDPTDYGGEGPKECNTIMIRDPIQ
ncbi:acyl-CoA N-acyltransferase [Delitschia confertaspora ATCC 74209]|uniref:Acyl-CoA N-acyltransferase n=1 Tax=Delitschia confertaspora ATCC 74209 TaxID=1513339 RepID=A0A9P4JF57_9PLEO|nr:acyl-CoA N-acyltransferase [Delitschia confertaspora ATCC 74209]